MTEQQHIDSLLDDWLDERLAPQEQAAVERHLADCETCRSAADGLRLTRAVLRESVEDPPLPAGLEDRVRRALDREDAARAEPASVVDFPVPASEPRRRPRWTSLAAAAVFVAVLGGALLWRSPTSLPPDPVARNPVAAAFADYHAIAAEPDSLAVADAAALDERWRQARLDFPVRVLDLSAMGIELVGGGVRSFDGRPAALALYGDGGGRIACWMFRGRVADLPPPVEEHVRGALRFRVYREDGVTLVVWREGEVLCALAGRGDSRRVVELAFGKAMAPVQTETSSG